MTDQLQLHLEPLKHLPRDRHKERKLSITEAFHEFHATNPWVYDALVSITRDLRSRGRDKVGVGMLFEVLRWHYWRQTDDASSDFKLNNNYRSRYARLIMKQERDLADVFDIRNLRSA